MWPIHSLRRFGVFLTARAIGHSTMNGDRPGPLLRLKRRWNSIRVWGQLVLRVRLVLQAQQDQLVLLAQQAVQGQRDLLVQLELRDLQAQRALTAYSAQQARQAQQVRQDLLDLQDQLDQLVLMVHWEPPGQLARRAELARRVQVARQEQSG